MKNQRTLVLLKADAFQARVWYKVIRIFKDQGLKISGVRFFHPDRSLMEKLYAVHRNKPFFELLIQHMVSGLQMALCLEGPGAIEKARETCFRIRKDYSSRTNLSANVVHSSDSSKSARRELKLFFGNTH